MIEKYLKNEFNSPEKLDQRGRNLKEKYIATEKQVLDHFDNYQFNKGIERIFDYIRDLNRYIVESEPWSLAKSETKQAELIGILKTLVRAILSINILLSPIIPETSEKVKQIFNHNKSDFGWKDPGETFTINKVEQLFPRVEINDFFADEKDEKKEEAEKMENQEKIEGLIDFEEFKKVKMVIAQVIEAEKVADADKLLKLTVDTKADQRTLVAGVATHYQPEDLLDKKIIIVKNLKPAKIRGILSQGMILAAVDSGGRPYIPIIPEDTPVGSELV
jgi:methionyl-tRNA synthetase